MSAKPALRVFLVLLAAAGLLAAGATSALLLNDSSTAPTTSANARNCPEANAMSSRRDADLARECALASRAQQALERDADVTASVSVRLADSATLLGPTQRPIVTAQVDIAKGAKSSWDAERAARTIASITGADLSDIAIVDESLEPIFDPATNADGMARALPLPRAATASTAPVTRER